jgi:hypothetical protein
MPRTIDLEPQAAFWGGTIPTPTPMASVRFLDAGGYISLTVRGLPQRIGVMSDPNGPNAPVSGNVPFFVLYLSPGTTLFPAYIPVFYFNVDSPSGAFNSWIIGDSRAWFPDIMTVPVVMATIVAKDDDGQYSEPLPEYMPFRGVSTL